MANFVAELRRRNVFRVGAAYAVVAWISLQLVNNLTPALRLPDWASSLVVVLLLVGFPVALLFTWAHELPPETGATPPPATTKRDWFLCSALVVVFALVVYQQLSSSPGASTAQQAPGAATQGGISIAVLPFANMSGDAGQEFFSDGITEEINGALAKVPDLRVVGRTSAFQFKGQSKDLRAIGQGLSARYLIEGSVRKSGAQVRIAAQLIRAEDGVQLWAESYDRELTNIFAIQEDIAQAIAAALKVPLGLQQGENLVSNRTIDLESYQQYLHARALVRARGIPEAINMLEPVVANDPNYAPAWALLATAYALTPGYPATVLSGSVEDERRFTDTFLDKAESAARKATQLDSRFANGYGALAYAQFFRGKWTEAEQSFEQALMLDPSDPEVLHAYRQFLIHIGRLKDSLSASEKLRMLEPFVPVYNLTTAAYMQINGQNDASIPILEAIPASIAAGGYNRNVYLAQAYAAAGRFAEAADTLLLITGNQASRRTVQDAARLLRSAPTKVEAPQELPDLRTNLNFVYAYVGALDRVMEAPERTLETHYSSPADRALWLPLYAPLRKTERFKAYARKIGLVDYWRNRGWPDLCRPIGADDFVCD